MTELQNLLQWHSIGLILLIILAILFLQSGLDKITDYQGNLLWLKGHFSKSLFKNIVPFLLVTITIMEVVSGLLSLVGALMLFASKQPVIGKLGAILSLISLTCLFLGQRIAKDYAGAASLVPYILLAASTFGVLQFIS
ncbi:MAG: DoxX family protein [Flavobacteriales bacterium]|nr:DoxX family protein [Flavobacteriales bacterium]